MVNDEGLWSGNASLCTRKLMTWRPSRLHYFAGIYDLISDLAMLGRVACSSSSIRIRSLAPPPPTFAHDRVLVPHDAHARVLVPHDVHARVLVPHDVHDRVLVPHDVHPAHEPAPCACLQSLFMSTCSQVQGMPCMNTQLFEQVTW